RRSLDSRGHAQLRQGAADADYGHRPRRRSGAFSQRQNWNGILKRMSPAKKTRSLSNRRAASAEVQLPPERELRATTDRVLRIAKSSGIPETEVHVDEVIDALTRFANNSIHQHVAEHGLTLSLRVVVDGRTARVTTNRIEEDALRAALESAASLAASQPKDRGILPLPGKHKYRAVRRFSPPTAAL